MKTYDINLLIMRKDHFFDSVWDLEFIKEQNRLLVFTSHETLGTFYLEKDAAQKFYDSYIPHLRGKKESYEKVSPLEKKPDGQTYCYKADNAKERSFMSIDQLYRDDKYNAFGCMVLSSVVTFQHYCAKVADEVTRNINTLIAKLREGLDEEKNFELAGKVDMEILKSLVNDSMELKKIVARMNPKLLILLERWMA